MVIEKGEGVIFMEIGRRFIALREKKGWTTHKFDNP